MSDNINYIIKRLELDPDIHADMKSMTEAEIDLIVDYIICIYNDIKRVCDVALKQARMD